MAYNWRQHDKNEKKPNKIHEHNGEIDCTKSQKNIKLLRKKKNRTESFLFSVCVPGV